MLMYNVDDSDVTYKDNPRTERIQIFLMAVDQQHRYSNQLERAN